VDLFRKRYFSDSLRLQKEAEFIRIEQGNQSVYEYERKFAELSRFAPHMVDIEVRKARHFERGLREEIQGPVSMFKLETYAEVVDRALIAERNCKHLSKTSDEETCPSLGEPLLLLLILEGSSRYFLHLSSYLSHFVFVFHVLTHPDPLGSPYVLFHA
jgi:hypothetical protein